MYIQCIYLFHTEDSLKKEYGGVGQTVVHALVNPKEIEIELHESVCVCVPTMV